MASTAPDAVLRAGLLATVADIRATVRAAEVQRRPARVLRQRRTGPPADLLLAPLPDSALRDYTLRTIRCVRQRSLTDFVL
jgi:hypothetical protein